MSQIIGLLNCHNSPELGGLTSSRPLASTSFLGRFAFCDFALSNFCNAGIDAIGVLIKDHQRSMLKHMGNLSSWTNNTKIGRETIFYNERGILNPAYNTDVANVKENDWVLYDSQASTIVVASPHIVANIDLRPIIEEHMARGEDLTVVYKPIKDADKEFIGSYAFNVNKEGYVVETAKNAGRKKEANVSLEVWIMKRDVLFEILKAHERVDMSFGFRETMEYLLKAGRIKVHAVPWTGYARRFDSFKHYIDYSFEMLNPEIAASLFVKERPIYTLTHDTPPALYGSKANVSDSFVSNGCIVEGTVRHSIICRDVKVGKDAVVEDSIVFSNVSIGDKATVKNCVIDKYSIITARHAIEGDGKTPIYLKQGAIL